MKKTTSNDLRKTYSGIFGNQVVLKNRGGKIIMTIMPPRPADKPTENQVTARDRFRLASQYAKNILKYPEMLAAYSAKLRKGLTAYNLALKDYFNPPFVSRIDVSDYHGNPGEKISVTAGDDFRVTGVTIRIIDASGILAEQGACALRMPQGNWDYMTTASLPETRGAILIAKAIDIPGNTGELAVTL